jgi:hypothetical protein
MAKPRPEYRHGRIIGAFLHTKSRGRELHPAVILTPDSAIIQPELFDPRQGGENAVVVVGVTTKYKLYEDQFIKLPFHPSGHQTTKLNKDCAAVIGWYDKVAIPDDVHFWAGDVPASVMVELNNAVRTDLAKRLSKEFANVSDAFALLFGD